MATHSTGNSLGGEKEEKITMDSIIGYQREVSKKPYLAHLLDIEFHDIGEIRWDLREQGEEAKVLTALHDHHGQEGLRR